SFASDMPAALSQWLTPAQTFAPGRIGGMAGGGGAVSERAPVGAWRPRRQCGEDAQREAPAATKGADLLKMLLIIPALAAVAIAGTEVTFRLRPEMTQEAQSHVMRMAVAAQCPDKPDALQIATADAYQFSL